MLHHSYQAGIPRSNRREREALLAAFAAQGFPNKEREDWHYTDFSPLAEQGFIAAKPGEVPSYPYDPAQSLPLAEADPLAFSTGFALDGLNAAHAAQGINKIWEGSSHKPLLITHADPAQHHMAHWRHQLSLLENASATLVIWDAPGEVPSNPTLLTAVLRIALSANAQLTVIRMQQSPATATRALHVQAQLLAGAKLTLIDLELSEAKSRFELHAELAGAGARIEAFGLTAIKAKAHADVQVKITHAAPHCTSLMDFRLLAAGRAKAVFNGKVVVAEGAVKTDSQTHCKSLLLSPNAEIDAKPELEINADDVKCAHGATFGQLDDKALFYLRSRGVGSMEARGLLTQAFAEQVLERIPHEGLHAHVQGALQSLLNEASA